METIHHFRDLEKDAVADIKNSNNIVDIRKVRPFLAALSAIRDHSEESNGYAYDGLMVVESGGRVGE